MCIPIQLLTFHSAIGWIGVAFRGEVIHELKFGATCQTELDTQFPQTFLRIEEPTAFARDFKELLLAYAEGKPASFEHLTVFDKSLTPFQRSVSRECRAIGYGQTVSYGQLAKRVGSPGASRAVGTVMSQNPIPLIIPCHRVIGANSRIGGFSAADGTPMKRRLLELEGALLF